MGVPEAKMTVVDPELSYDVTSEETVMGAEVSPGNWTGIIGDVITGKADMMWSGFPVISELLPYVKYSSTYYTLISSILSGPPLKVYESSIPLTTVLRPTTWVALVLSWLAISVVSTALCHLEFKMLDDDWNKIKSFKFRSVLQDDLLGFYGLLFQRGFDNLPSGIGRRILVAGWLILSVVLMTDVAGSFASMLSVRQSPERINNVEDILKQPTIFPYILHGWREHQVLKTAEDETLKAVWKRVVDNDGFIMLEELGDPKYLDDVNQGRAVLLGFRDSLLELLVGILCQTEGGGEKDFYIADKDFDTQYMALVLNKKFDSETVEAINQALLLLFELGWFDKAVREVLLPSRPCMTKTTPKVVHETQALKGLKQLFQFYAVGNIAAFVVLILECIVAKYT